MSAPSTSPIAEELWLANILWIIRRIADRVHQEQYWLSSEGDALDDPNELINSLDDVVFNGYIETFGPAFSNSQRSAAEIFTQRLHAFVDDTPPTLYPAQVLYSEQWNLLRLAATDFVEAFARNDHSTHL